MKKTPGGKLKYKGPWRWIPCACQPSCIGKIKVREVMLAENKPANLRRGKGKKPA